MADRGTHCKLGHEYSRRSDGRQICRMCERNRVKQARQAPEKRAELTDYMRGWRGRNRERHNRNWRNLRARKVEKMRQLKAARGCKECGETHPACLEFHHRDPEQKEFLISSVAFRLTESKLLAEIEKCDVLCSNCHRKHHWGYLVRGGISAPVGANVS